MKFENDNSTLNFGTTTGDVNLNDYLNYDHQLRDNYTPSENSNPCANCSRNYQAWWGIISPCRGCKYSREMTITYKGE